MEEISVVDSIDLLRFFSRLPGQNSEQRSPQRAHYYSHLRRTFMEGGERAQPTNHKGGQREREAGRFWFGPAMNSRTTYSSQFKDYYLIFYSMNSQVRAIMLDRGIRLEAIKLRESVAVTRLRNQATWQSGMITKTLDKFYNLGVEVKDG